MLGMSNAAVAGMSLAAATTAAVTVAAVNGVFDPWLSPEDNVASTLVSEPAETGEAAPAAEPTTEAAAPAPETEPEPEPEQAEAILPTNKPSVDIVRVEPSGDAVIAGQAEPGAIVAIVSNGEVVGKGVATETGDWAIVIEEPLKPGGHDIAVEARKDENAEPVRAEESITVHIPTDSSEGVLVAANRPGVPTEVLQAPNQVPAAVAAAEPEPSGERTDALTETAETTEGEAVTVAAADNAVEPETSRSLAGASEETASEAAPVEEVVASEEPAAPVDVAEVVTPQTETVSEAPAEPAETPREPVETAVERIDQVETVVAAAPIAKPATTSSAAPEVVTAAEAETTEEPAQRVEAPAPAPEEPAPSVTVMAVEVEAGQVYVAGQSTGSGPVRVYIEDQFVGETEPNKEGQWLLSAQQEVEVGENSVRADKVEDEEGTVTARAEVVFERDPEAVALLPVVASGSGTAQIAAGPDVDGGKRQVPALIIRKGDNLWRISRRHYGQGIRYTTIYQANRDQIRKPDLIFPGQIFLIPERDESWASNESGVTQ